MVAVLFHGPGSQAAQADRAGVDDAAVARYPLRSQVIEWLLGRVCRNGTLSGDEGREVCRLSRVGMGG
ncbi:hypothetical protein D3C80_1901760 [compost metagenome]